MKTHIGNVINRPPQQNAHMFRVLTSLILKEIDWGFRKYMSTKIHGMMHQGLLVPQGLQYQQGENGQPVKIQELRTFLQTNMVRLSDTDKCIFLTAG